MAHHITVGLSLLAWNNRYVMRVKVRYEDGTCRDAFRIMNGTQQGFQVKSGMDKMLTTVFSVSRHFTHPKSNSHITDRAVNAATYRMGRRYETDPYPLHAKHRGNCIECSHQKPKFLPKSYYISVHHGCVWNKFAVQNGSSVGSDNAFLSGKN
jgi:hypothetical protein